MIDTGTAIFAVGLGFLVQAIGWMFKADRAVRALERLAEVLEKRAAQEKGGEL